MTDTTEHFATIHPAGRSFQARCSCGWADGATPYPGQAKSAAERHTERRTGHYTPALFLWADGKGDLHPAPQHGWIAFPTVRFTGVGEVDAPHAVFISDGDPAEVCVRHPTGGYVLVGRWQRDVAESVARDLAGAITAWATLGR